MTPSFSTKTVLLLILFKMLLTMVCSQNNCKASTRGKNFIIAFPQNYGDRELVIDLHILIASFHDGITEVKINSSFKLSDNTHFMRAVTIQSMSFERVSIPGELELFGTEKSFKTVEITADFEVSVDSFHLERYTSDGFLAIPTVNLGTQYVVTSYEGPRNSVDGTFFTVIGSQNDTIVSVQLRSEVFYENKHYNPSDTLNLNLSKYEVIQILSTNDLTGSIISSDKPIGVMSGHSCTSTLYSYCDTLLEQNIPVRDWGTNHFYSTTGRQDGTSIYRMIAFFNDTSFNVNGTNITLNSGNFSEFNLSGNGLIVTSKPAFMIQILLEINGFTIEPSIIHVPTEEQFVSTLGFVTPTQSNFSTTDFIHFVNILVKSDEKFSLRLNEVYIHEGNASHLPVLVNESKIMGSDYDLLVIQLPSEEAVYYITQELSNSSPISAIVYGYASFISYGYVAALSLNSDLRVTTVFPSYTRLTGGDELNLRLPCLFSDVSTFVCQFGNSTSEAKYIKDKEISCITPPLFEVGFMTVFISTNNGSSFPFTGSIYVADEDSLTPHISQNPEDVVLDLTSNRIEVLNWNPNIFNESTKLTLGIQFISDPISDSTNWESIILIDEVQNSGEVNFDISKIPSQKRQSLERLTNPVGNFVINTMKGERDKFITGKLKIIKNSKETFQNCPSNTLLTTQPTETSPCPCTTLQARSDGNFFEENQFIDFFHPGSDICYRSSQTPSGSSQECCYRNGIINTDKMGAGTASTFSPDKNPIKHFQYDLLPWYSCCKISNNCDVYLKYRPSDDCKNYVHPIPSRTNGDPHFKSLDGVEYTFNGAGEFELISSSINNFTFQVRMEIFQNSSASVYTAFVIRTEYSSKIQIERNFPNQVQLFIDDQVFELKDGILSNFIARETKIQIAENYSQVIISFSRGIALKVHIYPTSMAFLLQLDEQYKNNVKGLLGNFNGDPIDDFMLPNGTIISHNSSLLAIHYKFGLHWMIDEVESLFTYQPPFSFDFYSKPNFIPSFVNPALHNISFEVEELCGDSLSCLYDAMTTGKLSFAEETLQFNAIFEDILNASRNIISCGRPYSVENGSINGSVFFAGSRIRVVCNTGYQINGSAELICDDNGEWFPVYPTCTEFTPPEPEIIPEITSPSTNITKTLNRIDTAIENIECVATGIPAPVIYWTRDFMTKFIDSPILQIDITDLSTDGVFYCVAENNAGRDVVSVNYIFSLTTEVIMNELDEINNGIDNVESISDEESEQTAALVIVIIDAANNNSDINSENRSRILESAVMLTQMIIEKTNGTFSNETTERITELLSSIVDGSSTIQESEQVAVTQEQREQSTVATISSALAITLNTLERFSQRLSEELANSELNSVKIVESRLITIVVQNVDLENSGDDGETQADIVLPKKNSNNVQYSVMITFSTNLALDLSTDKRSFVIATSIVRRIGSKVPAAGESTQGSDILTISIGGKSGTVELAEEATFSFDVYSNQPSESTCVFLNGTRWVSEGLSTEQKTANLTNCISSHFTSFAVFVTPYDSIIPPKESIALSAISYAFVGISFIFLIISLILFLIAGKAFFKVEANIIYFNYCLSMLLATGLFIFGIQVGTYNIVLCQIIAFLLHYSWLSVFTWTLCIGIFIMYKIVISVLSTRKIYRYLIIFGWIFPLLIPIITIAVARDYYVNVNSHCFLNVEGGVIWGFIGPILSIIVINALFLIISLIRIIQTQSTDQNKDSRKVIKDALITGLVLTPVLGLPWLILILNVAIQHSVLEWVFIFINGLMGLIFFFVVVLRNKEVLTRFKKRKYTTNSNLVQFTGQNVSSTTNASYLTSDRFKKTNTLERQLKKESELQGASIEACEVYTSPYDTGDNIYAVVSGEKKDFEAGTSEIAEESITGYEYPIYSSADTLDEPPIYHNLAEIGMLTEIHMNPVYSPQVVATQDDVDGLYDQADVTNSDEAVYESAK